MEPKKNRHIVIEGVLERVAWNLDSGRWDILDNYVESEETYTPYGGAFISFRITGEDDAKIRRDFQTREALAGTYRLYVKGPEWRDSNAHEYGGLGSGIISRLNLALGLKFLDGYRGATGKIDATLRSPEVLDELQKIAGEL